MSEKVQDQKEWQAPAIGSFELTPEELARIDDADDPKAALIEIYREHRARVAS